jgi:hypothetical protein
MPCSWMMSALGHAIYQIVANFTGVLILLVLCLEMLISGRLYINNSNHQHWDMPYIKFLQILLGC